MSREDFIKRVIILTNEKEYHDNNYKDLMSIKYACTLPSSIRKELDDRIEKVEWALNHIDSNIKLNRDMADRLWGAL
mgnify:CR=1 FL=1|jgi:hypothetical protein|tara:strand:- start:55 stop:285 length:231 start_codon:yes stop_codon:yes gene_type:complete